MPAEARARSEAMAKEMLTALDEVRAASNSPGLETDSVPAVKPPRSGGEKNR